MHNFIFFNIYQKLDQNKWENCPHAPLLSTSLHSLTQFNSNLSVATSVTFNYVSWHLRQGLLQWWQERRRKKLYNHQIFCSCLSTISCNKYIYKNAAQPHPSCHQMFIQFSFCFKNPLAHIQHLAGRQAGLGRKSQSQHSLMLCCCGHCCNCIIFWRCSFARELSSLGCGFNSFVSQNATYVSGAIFVLLFLVLKYFVLIMHFITNCK